MARLLTFRRGGVHPPEKKSLSRGEPISRCPDPETLIIPFAHHLGAPAKPLVSPGDEVKPGDKIGESAGFISAHVHTPMGGKVKEIRSVYLPAGFASPAAVIEADPGSSWSGTDMGEDACASMDPKEMISRVQEAGIVGMGGAAFPAHVKFMIPKGKQAEYLIINGVECEPYLNADNRLMIERTDDVLSGAMYIQKMIGAREVIIGIESNKPESLQAMTQAVSSRRLPFTVRSLKVRYPQGDEKQLIEALLKREVPSGGLPIDIGAVVSNVGTALAVYEALRMGKPLMERVLTISGEAASDPKNVLVKVGTPISHVIEHAGGFSSPPDKVVIGGPMMGFSIYDLSTPVMKGTSGILALTKHQVNQASRTPCISCGRCVQACPMGLNPTKLYKLIDHGNYDEAKQRFLLDCKECGCCSYICVAKIPLVQGMRWGKLMLRKKQS